MTDVCAWCGATLGTDVARAGGRVLCPSCGAATIDPFPSEQELTAAYGEWYRPASGRRFAALGDPLLRRTRGALAGRIDAIAPPGRVLDVGAGDGTLIDALAHRGRGALGLEREPRRADIRDVPLAALDEGWAAIVFWHALEHLPEPGTAVRDAARLLAPGGVLVVAVPDAASVQARIFGDRWLHLDPPRHLVHLTTHALRDGLTRAGLRVERISRVRGGQNVIGWLDGLVGTLPGLDLYRALRHAGARDRPMSRWRRLASVGAGALLFPLACLGAGTEALLGRSGTVYVEARRVG